MSTTPEMTMADPNMRRVNRMACWKLFKVDKSTFRIGVRFRSIAKFGECQQHTVFRPAPVMALTHKKTAST